MERTLRFLALGDSYTIGEGVAPAERWPDRVVERLRADGIAIADPEIVAKTSWTTEELDAAIDVATIDPPYDIVSLMIGVNDQYRGYPLEEFRERFGHLLDRAIAFAGGEPMRVFTISIPDWGVTPFAEGRDRESIAAEIDRFNEVSRQVAGGRGAAWINVTDLSRDEPGDVVDDRLHPSARQYARWTERIAPLAAAISVS